MGRLQRIARYQWWWPSGFCSSHSRLVTIFFPLDSFIIEIISSTWLFAICRTLKIGNKNYSLRPLIGCPFGSSFQIENGKEGPYLSCIIPSAEGLVLNFMFNLYYYLFCLMQYGGIGLPCFIPSFVFNFSNCVISWLVESLFNYVIDYLFICSVI